MTIKDLLTTYWSQLTLILVGVGYLLQRTLDIRSKKIEINHTLFQQKRLESTNNFFTFYAKTEQMWIDFPIHAMLDNLLSAKQIDEIVYTPLNEMKRNVLELQIYFHEDEHRHFEQILRNLKDINASLKGIYFDTSLEVTKTAKILAFNSFRDEKLKENVSHFKDLTTLLKSNFFVR